MSKTTKTPGNPINSLAKKQVSETSSTLKERVIRAMVAVNSFSHLFGLSKQQEDDLHRIFNKLGRAVVNSPVYLDPINHDVVIGHVITVETDEVDSRSLAILTQLRSCILILSARYIREHPDCATRWEPALHDYIPETPEFKAYITKEFKEKHLYEKSKISSIGATITMTTKQVKDKMPKMRREME